MGPDPRIIDDIAKVAGGAVNIVSGIQEQVKEDIKSRMDEMVQKMDLVPREDFDHAMDLITKLRERIDNLESQLNELNTTKKSSKSSKK
jgi:BMFP domain-containing protein YqiC